MDDRRACAYLQRVEHLFDVAQRVGDRIGPFAEPRRSDRPSTNSMIITSWLSAVSAVRRAAMCGWLSAAAP